MKVFITGASGFLGRHVIDRLIKEKADITALVRSVSPVAYLKENNVKLVYGNVREDDCIAKGTRGADVVIHAATSKGGRWEDFYEDNVKGIERLLKYSVQNKVKRFIFISSVAVYDHSQVKNGQVLDEDTPYESVPSNNYSRSKIEAEKLVTQYHLEHGLNTVILRPACLYGPDGGMNKLYPSRLGFGAGANGYAVLGRGKTAVPLSHIDSVADAIWRCIQSDQCIGKSYNIVEDEPVTRIAFLKILKTIYKPAFKIKKIPFFVARLMGFSLRLLLKIMGKPAPSRLAPSYLKLFAISVFYNNERLKRDTGWKPLPDTVKTVEDTMRYYVSRRVPRSKQLVPKGKIEIKNSEVLRVAIAGCGAFAKTHLRTLKKMKNVDVVALCDPNPDALSNMASQYNIKHAFGSVTEMLNHMKIDVLHVTSSAQTHAPLSIEAMRKGCHVYVEKPVALDTKETELMYKTAKEQKVKLCAGHSLLYDALAVEARDLYNRGVLGEVVQVEGWFGTSLSSNRGSPYLRYEAKNHWAYQMPGSLYQNFLSHPLSVVLDFMEDIQDVKATAVYNKVVPHMKSDELRIVLKGEHIIGNVVLSMDVTPRQNFVKIYGTKGTLYIDFMYKNVLLYKDVPMMPKAISRQLTALKQARALTRAGMRNLFKLITGRFNLFESNERILGLFYKSILDDDPLPVSMDNAVQSMQVMDQIWKQIDT